mgnify:CR=1 FL=1
MPFRTAYHLLKMLAMEPQTLLLWPQVIFNDLLANLIGPLKPLALCSTM